MILVYGSHGGEELVDLGIRTTDNKKKDDEGVECTYDSFIAVC